MEQLEIKRYKKGEKIKTAGIYLKEVAGADLSICSAYGIYADVFDKGKYYQVPNVLSLNKGSGKFLDFLITLKRGLDKPIYFCAITNMGIYKYLHFAGIGVVEFKNGKPQFYEVITTVAHALKKVKNKKL
jgi:hypothetical protein